MIKQFLMGVAAFAFTVSASAADITNPFYLPTKGQIGSITTAGYERSKSKGIFINNASRSETGVANGYDKQIGETLQFGLTDQVALFASVSNSFSKLRTKTSEGVNGYLDSDNNTFFTGGLAWNILTGPARLQVNASYGQVHDGSYKSVAAEVKAGYQFKKFLPYISVAEELPVTPSGYNKPGYSAKVGLYQGACEVWALDTGIRWLHDELGEQRGYNAEAEASYYLTPKSALSLYGTYLMDGKAKGNTSLYDKSIGVRLRWYFN